MGAYNYSECSSGLVLPLFDESQWSPVVRALLYLAGLLYCFLGIAVVADIFMCAIERITSQTYKVRVVAQQVGGDGDDASDIVVHKEVRVWNGTVANLTLMALGSSAPEILLATIEIVGHGFKAGKLGPGTIVGSAAFNLMIITAICIVAIPEGETRSIADIWVFITTASYSIFAYIWLFLMICVFSPGEVEVWEGALTLLFFVALIISAYLADKDICSGRRAPGKKDEDGETTLPLRSDGDKAISELRERMLGEGDISALEYRELERKVALEFPHLSAEELAKLIAWRVMQSKPHDRLWYRIESTRRLTSSVKKQQYYDPSVAPKPAESLSTSTMTLPGVVNKRVIEFSARVYAIMPDEHRARLKIVRRGRNLQPLLFKYETLNGQAKKTEHFLPKSEMLRFEPGETEKAISIELVKDAAWKNGQMFYVHLEIQSEDTKVTLGRCKVAEVVYLEQSDGADCVIEFVKNHAAVEESCGFARLPVVRRNNFHGGVKLSCVTQDGTAEAGKDYEGGESELEFGDGEVEKYIDITIIDDLEEEKDETFTVTLHGASTGARVGVLERATVTILNDDGTLRYFKQMDRLVPRMLDSLTPGMESWTEQIVKATSVNAGDVADATLVDCLLHMVAFPWKASFALVPPPALFGGWLTFFVALALIGVITAVVGDLASIFGCIIGLDDAVTAITLVALGTSLPDTFASKLAATQDPHADNAIGNVTGSNSVNVFLGLGLPWLLAAVHWAGAPDGFVVPTAGLGLSVGVYTVCACLAVALLMARRYLAFFGKAELGGPTTPKWISAIILVGLWCIYILFSVLSAYDIL